MRAPTIEAPQRRLVVVALEAALAHLPERDEREHLAGRARGIRQRDVGEQVDVDDLAGEQLDGRVVARDQGERDAARASVAAGEGLGVIAGLSSGRAVAQTRKTALGRSVVWEREHTAVSGRATTW